MRVSDRGTGLYSAGEPPPSRENPRGERAKAELPLDHRARKKVMGSSSVPGAYCRCCGYILDHLPEPRCPECGREFNREDRSTYLTRPRGVARSARVALIGVWLVLALVVGELAFAKYGGTRSKANMNRATSYVTAVVAFPLGTLWLLSFLSEDLFEYFDEVEVLLVPFIAAWFVGFFLILWRAKRRWFLAIPIAMLVIAFLGDVLLVYYG